MRSGGCGERLFDMGVVVCLCVTAGCSDPPSSQAILEEPGRLARSSRLDPGGAAARTTFVETQIAQASLPLQQDPSTALSAADLASLADANLVTPSEQLEFSVLTRGGPRHDSGDRP